MARNPLKLAVRKPLAIALLAVGGVGLAAFAAHLLKPKKKLPAAQKTAAAAPGTQVVGVASGTTPLSFFDTGPVDYTYIPDRWSYTGTRKDW